MKALLIALLLTRPIVPVQISEVWLAMQKYKFIEEHHLERVQLSCYLPTGYRTADGTVPYEGVVSSNTGHLGMDCILYDAQRDEFVLFAYDMDRAWQFIGDHGTWAYIEWIPREEGKEDGEGNHSGY